MKDFSIGFGPQLLGFTDGDGIRYSLRALPLGGYVSFPEGGAPSADTSDASEEAGGTGAAASARSRRGKDQEEDGEEEEVIPEDDPDLLQNRPAIQRAIVISAGVVFNMLLAFAAIFGSVTINGVLQPEIGPGVTVVDLVDKTGAGARYGMQPGDVVLGVDGRTLPAAEGVTDELVGVIRTSGGKVLHFTVQRAGLPEPVKLDLVPDTRAGEGVIGVRLSPNIGKVTVEKPSSLADAISITASEFQRLTSQTFKGLVNIISHMGQAGTNLAGPVGVMQMGAEAGKQGAILSFAAVISINLGLMNSLPLPALDGGQLLLILFEVARGKPVNQDVARAVNGAFLSGLLLLSLFLLVGDIERLLPF